eukprot:328845-Pleurochrysis_carterae.AAC.6
MVRRVSTQRVSRQGTRVVLTLWPCCASAARLRDVAREAHARPLWRFEAQRYHGRALQRRALRDAVLRERGGEQQRLAQLVRGAARRRHLRHQPHGHHLVALVYGDEANGRQVDALSVTRAHSASSMVGATRARPTECVCRTRFACVGGRGLRRRHGDRLCASTRRRERLRL